MTTHLGPDPSATIPGFAEFWAAYPRRCPRRNRAEALKAWRRLEPPLVTVLAALAWQDTEYLDWQADGGRYIEAPSVWLNNRRWERERPVVMPPGKSAPGVRWDAVADAIDKGAGPWPLPGSPA